MQNNGIFLALEGPAEAVGIAELQAVRDRLVQAGYDVDLYDFPYYDQPSSYFVRNYIEERYGSKEELSPYTSALFFALDRYQLAKSIEESLQAGKVVLAHNFTGATMAAQGVRFENVEQQRGFLIWLDNLEFVMLRLPRPDLNLVLGDSKDRGYQILCSLFPKDFQLIAHPTKQPLAETVFQHVQNLKPTAINLVDKPAASYYIPETFDDEIRQQYIDGIDKITAIHDRMFKKIKTSNPRAAELLRPVLPVATLKHVPRRVMSKAVGRLLADQENFDTQQANKVELLHAAPRNEMDLLPDIAYEQLNGSYETIARTINQWPYTKKLDLFDAYIGLRTAKSDLPGAALQRAHYQWEIVGSFETLHDISLSPGVHIKRQTLSPRYGYDVPAAIDETELTDEYLECFDLSLALHSKLEAAGYHEEAEYVTLLGHKLRWTADFNAQAAFSLLERASAPETSVSLGAVLAEMHQHLGNVHPLLAEAMVFVGKPR